MPHSDIHGSTPARGSPWLFAACHVLHRLLVPRHPPNALILLEIIRPFFRKTVHHARKPSTGSSLGPATAAGCNPRLDPINRFRLTTDPRSAHNNSLEPKHTERSLTPHSSVQRNFSNVSEPSSHKRLDATYSSGADDNPVRLTDARRDSISPYGPCHHARPETHQNLIHPDKEHLPPT